MPRYEILIPRSPRLPKTMELQIDADNWTEALRQGRRKAGETGDISQNMLCDIKDDYSIHVTDAGTGRVFRIVELSAARAPSAAPPGGVSIGRSLEEDSEATADYLEEVFERSQEIAAQPDRTRAMYFMLDLAMGKIGSDAGSVLLSDINEHDLFFGAARGPKAREVSSYRVKMGQGIVGFCAEEAVGLAVSDVNRDPRFYAAISEHIGYATRSILCVPMMNMGQVTGALELINKKGSDFFTERDLNVASFLAHQLAEHLQRQG